MFCVSEAEAAVIRTAFQQRGELSAVVELRRLFPGLGNIAWARECVRTIAGWQPLPVPSIAEVQAAQLAEQRATSPQIKQFAQRMTTDHTAADTELQQIAKQANFNLPTRP